VLASVFWTAPAAAVPCATDADCNNPNQMFCDPISLMCAECANNTHCAANEVCNPATLMCELGGAGGAGGAGGGAAVGGAGGTAAVGGAGGGTAGSTGEGGGAGGEMAAGGGTTGPAGATSGTTGSGVNDASDDYTGLAAEGGRCLCAAPGGASRDGAFGAGAIVAIAGLIARRRRKR
jgi:hypothetical protein